MAANVNGTSCDIVKGVPNELKTEVQTWGVPGVDGYGAQTLGQRGSEFRFQCVKYGTVASVNTWIAAMQAVQGSVVSLENDWGDTFDNMLIERVGQPTKEPAIGCFTGSPGARGQVMIYGKQVPAAVV